MTKRGAASYRILDEPVPGKLENVTVQPFWPLLAGMLCGLWVALPWFAVNGEAMGSATKKKEQLIAVASTLLITTVSVLLVWLLEPAVDAGRVDDLILRFSVLGLQLIKLATYYWLQAVQSRSFSLHEYYGGRTRTGVVVVVGGAILRPMLIAMLKPWPVLLLVLT